jgi:hypothetical protein
MSPGEAPFFRLWIATFCGYVALGATLQSLPDDLRSRFGARPAAVSITIGIPELAVAVLGSHF